METERRGDRMTEHTPEMLAALEALEAVLLFHSGGPWDAAKRELWDRLSHGNEATTKSLCDIARAAIAKAGATA